MELSSTPRRATPEALDPLITATARRSPSRGAAICLPTRACSSTRITLRPLLLIRPAGSAKPCFLTSLCMSFSAGGLSRRRCTSMSRNLALVIDCAPEVHLPTAIRTTISSRCHRSLGRGRRFRDLCATVAPNFRTQRRTVSLGNLEPALGNEILHVALAQGEAQIEPDCVLDDRGREAVSPIRELSHADPIRPAIPARPGFP